MKVPPLLPWSQRLSFILYWQILRREQPLFVGTKSLRSVLGVANFQIKKDNIKRKPLGQWYAFFGRFDNYVFAFTKISKCRPLFRKKVGKFGLTIEIKFIDAVTAFVTVVIPAGRVPRTKNSDS